MILVTGATGTVGSTVVRELASRGASVRVLVRDPSRAPAGVDVARGDLLDPASIDAALDGIDHAFLLTPFVPDQVTPQQNLIDACVRHGSVHVVKLGVIGAALDSPISVSRQHARIDAGLPASGLDWTVLAPHAFMQNLLGSGEQIRNEGSFVCCSGGGRIGTIDVRDIGAVAAVCLTEPGHSGKTYTLTGPESISYGEMAEHFSRVLGREVRYVDVPPPDFKAALVGAGFDEGLAEDLRGLYGDVFARGGGDVVTGAVAEVTGRPARSFDEFVADHRAVFGG